MEEKGTNTPSPSSRPMKPYPFVALNHFTVPLNLSVMLASLLRMSSAGVGQPGNANTARDLHRAACVDNRASTMSCTGRMVSCADGDVKKQPRPPRTSNEDLLLLLPDRRPER